MMRPFRNQYYPWRLFLKFFVSSILLLSSVAVISWIISQAFESKFAFIISFLFVTPVASLLMAHLYATPLKRVILKALRIANKKQVAKFEDDFDLFEEEPGEYFELEYALDKIRSKLKRRKTLLAHEREESQALMSSLVEAIVSVNNENKISSFNSKFATLFLNSEILADDRENLTLTKVFRDPEIQDLFEKALKNGQINSRKMKLVTALSQSPRNFSLTVSPLREEKGGDEIYGALASFHDITDLLMADKIRAEFVENASHELRTPLTAVKGYLETVKEDVAEKKYDQLDSFLNIITRNVDRLIDLVNDLLTISSLESNSSLKTESTDLNSLTRLVVEQLAPLAKEKDIAVQVNVEVPSWRVDAGKIEQVLNNLLSNAIKYIRSHDQVQIHWRKVSNGIELSVKDSGPGIPSEHLPRLFERFYRVDKARSRDEGGTGLGLAIVKHIMQSHGGSVRVLSDAGHGSEFICFFPEQQTARN